MRVGFSFGALSKSLEEQANEQGATFGNKAKKWEEAREALRRLRFNLDLPDGTYGKLQERLFDKMAKDVKAQPSDNSDYAKCSRELIDLNNDGDKWTELDIIDVLKKHFG